MLILGCNVGSETHYMRAIDTRGRELSKSVYSFNNDSEGFQSAKEWAVQIAAGEFDMLLTGDVEGEGEEQLTERLEEQYRDRTWEILKVAHHGSKNSSSEGFLRQVKPAYALISAGRENRYGHPHQKTIERLIDARSKIYSTQENGAIIVEIEDGWI